MADEPMLRIIVPMPRELIARIEDYRYRHRHPSRAEAIRAMIEAVLSPEAEAPAAPKPPRRKSPTPK